MLEPNLNRVASRKLPYFSANLGELGTASSQDPAALPCNDLSLAACRSEFVFSYSSDVMVLIKVVLRQFLLKVFCIAKEVFQGLAVW